MLSMQIPYTITLIYDTLYSHFKKPVQYSDKKYVNRVANMFTVHVVKLSKYFDV